MYSLSQDRDIGHTNYCQSDFAQINLWLTFNQRNKALVCQITDVQCAHHQGVEYY